MGTRSRKGLRHPLEHTAIASARPNQGEPQRAASHLGKRQRDLRQPCEAGDRQQPEGACTEYFKLVLGGREFGRDARRRWQAEERVAAEQVASMWRATPSRCGRMRSASAGSMVRVQRNRSAMPGPKFGLWASIHAPCRRQISVALQDAEDSRPGGRIAGVDLDVPMIGERRFQRSTASASAARLRDLRKRRRRRQSAAAWARRRVRRAAAPRRPAARSAVRARTIRRCRSSRQDRRRRRPGRGRAWCGCRRCRNSSPADEPSRRNRCRARNRPGCRQPRPPIRSTTRRECGPARADWSACRSARSRR